MLEDTRVLTQRVHDSHPSVEGALGLTSVKHGEPTSLVRNIFGRLQIATNLSGLSHGEDEEWHNHVRVWQSDDLMWLPGSSASPSLR